ncbi:MAG: DNA adenine methylase [Candidatus Omnitrophota bacterium]|nr:DNA adenine methylase [Candidatus Omnitrophota bacterium]
MKYIGNKQRLLDFIDSVIESENLPQQGIFIDIFTGTTNVAQHYKKKGYRIISNDFMTYSYIFQQAYIKNNQFPKFNSLLQSKYFKISPVLLDDKYEPLRIVVDYLNKLPGKKGFIYRHYAPAGEYKRQFFSNENAIRIDATREQLHKWKEEGLFNESEFYILLASLIDAADFVANISGTYGAYLKIWRSMALKPFTMLVPNLIESNLEHQVYKDDSNKIIDNLAGDILYIDPPYNSRQYAANFHILETLACWDEPKVYGKTGLRPYEEKKSVYSQKSKCKEFFAELIAKARTSYILMSYNNEGIIPHDFIIKTLSKRGDVRVYARDYRRFRTERDHENRHYKVHDDRVQENIYVVRIKQPVHSKIGIISVG